MKKTILFFLSMLLWQAVISQDFYGEYLDSNIYTASQIIGNTTTQPPDVAAFQKVNFVPVSNYTGRVNISIPIYEISIGGMKIPISIDYNSSGVKVNDMASSVGLNWSLNAGGMISRMVKGMDDFQAAVGVGDFKMGPSGWLGYQSEKFDDDYPIGTLSRYNDAEPDLFQVNAPRLSTKYIHERSYSLNPDTQGWITLYSGQPAAIELEQQGSKITETMGSTVNYALEYPVILSHGLQKVEIKAISGIVYNFASPDISTSVGGNIGYNAVTKLESLKLNSMYDPSTGQTVDFEYLAYSNDFYDEIDAGVTTYGDGTYLGFNPDKKMYTKYPYTHRLTKIAFDTGEVEFIYDLDRADNTGEKALTDIIIRDHLGNTIKHVKLSFSYFQSSIESTTPQSKRLRLDRVYEVDTNLNELPGYTFDYNTTLDMPPRTSYAHDFLGYNNGSYDASIIDPIPRLYFIYQNDLSDKHCYIGPLNTANSSELAIELTETGTTTYSLEANEAFAKTYSLTEMTFPTGGKNKYEYELNEFYYKGATRQGGGLRIKSQELDDGNGNIQILDYSYSGGSIANFPTYALMAGVLENPTTLEELLSDLGIDTFMTPQSQVEFTQGSFVGYGSVIVKNRVDNGKTQYFYKSPSDAPNILSTIEYDNTFPESDNWVVLKPQTLFLDRDYLRGKILAEHVYNKDGDIRLSKNYTYTQNEFDAISLGFLSVPPTPPTTYSCYIDGVYNLDQGTCVGYYETIDIPVARDLLTSVITTDYQTEKCIYSQDGHEDIPYTFQTEQTYVYDHQLPLVIQESKRVSASREDMDENQDGTLIPNDNDDIVLKYTTYPRTYGSSLYSYTTSSLPYASTLGYQNRLSTPLTIEYKNKDLEIISKEEHYYSDFGSVIALEKINFISRDGSIDKSETVTKRDTKGRIIEYKKPNGAFVCRLYGYDDNYLIAEASNANVNEIYHTSYEDDYVVNLGTPYEFDTSRFKTGRQSLKSPAPSSGVYVYYTPFVDVNNSEDKKYKFSAWVYSEAESADLFFFMKPNTEDGYFDPDYDYISKRTYVQDQWTLLEGEINVPSNMQRLWLRIDNNGGGDVWFDELRLSPADASMSTYTYKSLVGLKSITDERNQTSYYEYDSFNRLNLIKNTDQDIIQKTNYHYNNIPFMDVTTSVINANPSGSIYHVSVSTNVSDWTVSENSGGWLTAVKSGDGAIITASNNDSGSTRSATVTFDGGGELDYITVIQEYIPEQF